MSNITNGVIPDDLIDAMYRASGLGGADSSTFNVFNGLNMLRGIPDLPQKRDRQPINFWTRPTMNLTHNNIRGIRRMSYLMNTDPNSLGNALRCLLMPLSYDPFKRARSKIVDDNNVFMPLMTNTCLSLSGWPDEELEVQSTAQGIQKEQVSWADGKTGIKNAFSLTGTFQSLHSNPVMALLAVWIEYAARVYEGTMQPFHVMESNSMIDYVSRIYSVKLDDSGLFVRGLAMTGASFPTMNPIGADMNTDGSKHFSSENDVVSLTFHCDGCYYSGSLIRGIPFRDAFPYWHTLRSRNSVPLHPR